MRKWSKGIFYGENGLNEKNNNEENGQVGSYNNGIHMIS